MFSNDAIRTEEPIRTGEPIRLTESARTKIREMMSASGLEKQAVRIYGQAAGCAGAEYGMAFDRPGPSDLVIEAGGLTIIVDAESARALGRILIDFVDSAGRQGFLISRQPAETSCGCAT